LAHRARRLLRRLPRRPGARHRLAHAALAGEDLLQRRSYPRLPARRPPLPGENMTRTTARARALALALAMSVWGCSGYSTLPEQTQCADFESFRPVSDVLEKRCGSIDCHGRTERPLRFVGQFSMRKPLTPAELATHPEIDPKQYFPGGAVPTTDDERLDNYR